MTKVVVVIGTYNEADNITELLTRLGLVLDSEGMGRGRHAVIVVDSNSPDGTAELAGKFDFVTVISPEVNRGIAYAYRMGLREALYRNPDYVIQMDAGLTHEPEDIQPMVSLALGQKVGLVIGSRFSRVLRWATYRTAISLTAAVMMRRLGVEVNDATSGFRCWEANLLKEVLARPIMARHFAFQLETLHTAHRLGARIAEWPITYRLTNSSFRPGMLAEAVKVYLQLRRRA